MRTRRADSRSGSRSRGATILASPTHRKAASRHRASRGPRAARPTACSSRVESALDQVHGRLVTMHEPRREPVAPLGGQALMQGSQGREGRPQAARRRRTRPVRLAGEPGSELPEPAVVFLERASAAIRNRPRDEPQPDRESQPSMDLFQVRTDRPIGRPGTQDQQAVPRAVSPETCPAETAGPAQELGLGQRLIPPRIIFQDLIDSFERSRSARPGTCETVTRLDPAPRSPAPGVRPGRPGNARSPRPVRPCHRPPRAGYPRGRSVLRRSPAPGTG